ncbi:MAG TPA: Urease accessory protein UreE [Thermodesulfobacteriota bacterium]|jgi:urease accessory protein|nr:Urease accessory protein UreE [Thermodesulfobacteriota bacterium]
MKLIERKINVTNGVHLDGLERDAIVLGWEERRRTRQRLTTKKGTEIALALSTGTILTDGDILYMDDRCYIAVEAAKEDVIVIYPEDVEEGAVIAYELGNRHLPVSIGKENIVTLQNPQMEEFLRKTAIRHQLQKESFEPTRKGHSHA